MLSVSLLGWVVLVFLLLEGHEVHCLVAVAIFIVLPGNKLYTVVIESNAPASMYMPLYPTQSHFSANFPPPHLFPFVVSSIEALPDQRPLLPLMPNKAFLCHIFGWNHVFHLVEGLLWRIVFAILSFFLFCFVLFCFVLFCYSR